jgi:UDP-N-acetylmuramoylalanine--D-glutamate ligase
MLEVETADMERGTAYRRGLEGKTVAVVGLARSGVAAARLIARLGGRVLASDAAPREAWSAEARRLESPQIQAWSGHPDEAFRDVALAVVSPGVPLEIPSLAALRARGVPVISELELAFRVM